MTAPRKRGFKEFRTKEWFHANKKGKPMIMDELKEDIG